MSSIAKRQNAFEKALLAELSVQIKSTPWKKSGCALFTQSGDYYQDIFISVHRNAELTSVEMRIKPMALDPILWDILDIPENRDQPLSFRTWGAFICTGLPVFESRIEQSGDSPQSVARSLLNVSNDNLTAHRHMRASTPFSELVASHPNQIARSAYAVTLVTSLINDKNYDQAQKLAIAYASGEIPSSGELTRHNKSFHQLALDWLDAGKMSETALRAAAGE